jgi:hypothetical protein
MNTGAISEFVNEFFTRKYNIPLILLNRPRIMRLADGVINFNRSITHFAILNIAIKQHVEKVSCYVIFRLAYDIIFSLPWLNKYNIRPNIRDRSVTFDP